MTFTPTIYKYRTWSIPFHRSVLLKNELFYASPSDLNDPFDLKITEDYRLIDTKRKREQYADNLINSTIEDLIKKGINPVLKRKQIIQLLESDAEKMQKEYDDTSSIWTNNRFGVISFSERWDSILMWSHYAENHRGFCIGYDKKKIQNSKFFATAGNVKYYDIYPSIDPLNNDIISTLKFKCHTKSKEWEYEQEFRTTQLWENADPTIEERIIKVPENFISEVILGMMITEKDKSEIMKITSERNIPTYIISQKPRTFILQKELIQ